MTSKRDNTLDCACGILIIHMILGHIFQWPQLTTTHFYQWMNILYFFMPWFFFKAGIFYKKTPVKKVFSTSFHRLIVPFIALSLIGHAFLCISLVQEGGHTWQDFLINPMKDILLLGSTTGNFPLWFLLSLFFTKILYSLLNTQIPPTYITGISCLSESDSSLLMWAHYANNHKGMCVEYELLKISNQLKFTPVPVIYTNDRVTLSSLESENLDHDTMKIFVESITTKSSEWNYEKEWRIIRDEAACGTRWNKADKGALLEMIRPTSITLGCRSEGDFEKSVREYCEKEKVTLYKMEKNKDKYQLDKKVLMKFSE